jgi:hypothetical protein
MRQPGTMAMAIAVAPVMAAFLFIASPVSAIAKGDAGAHVVEGGSYLNSSGHVVHRPAHAVGGVPAGASARCRDGTYSFSEHRRGTCSHHGGVASWL